MRKIDHWTPRYIKNRIAEIYYQRSHSDLPWLTRSANEILVSYLRSSDVGLEFGSGRSTLWFAKHVKHITSLESHEAWYGKVSSMLKEASQKNVTYIYAPQSKNDTDGVNSEYVKAIDQIKTESVDFVLVDGIYRDYCAQKAIRTIRPGGALIIDNVNWYLPSASASPSSRTSEQGPKGPIWKEVSLAISDWRTIWTSSGVTDTAFFFKPCSNSKNCSA
jgi:predicted O-methyltransferase YrrM